MSRKEVLEDGGEIHYTKEGKFWYFVPAYELEILKKLDEQYEKELLKVMWGRK